MLILRKTCIIYHSYKHQKNKSVRRMIYNSYCNHHSWKPTIGRTSVGFQRCATINHFIDLKMSMIFKQYSRIKWHLIVLITTSYSLKYNLKPHPLPYLSLAGLLQNWLEVSKHHHLFPEWYAYDFRQWKRGKPLLGKLYIDMKWNFKTIFDQLTYMYLFQIIPLPLSYSSFCAIVV